MNNAAVRRIETPSVSTTAGRSGAMRGETLHIALYSGVAVLHDAVSQSFVAKIEYLQQLRNDGLPLSVNAFTHLSEYYEPSLQVVPSVAKLWRVPGFQAADVHIFEFGMCYDLFNVLFFVDKPTLVVDHNTTPPELVATPVVAAECTRAQLARHNLQFASYLATDSEYTRDELVAMGFDADKVTVMHLPATNAGSQRNRVFVDSTDGHDRPVKLLYVGRLVQAKGIWDLIEALEILRQRGFNDIHLTIAGGRRFGEQSVVDHLSSIQDSRLSVIFDAPDREIQQLFDQSDALVMPSHHEGYCVPAVEALFSGCYVIGVRSGNIPNVIGGLGTLAEVRTPASLADAIGSFVARLTAARRDHTDVVLPTSSGDLTETTWRAAVRRHLSSYTQEAFEHTFATLLARLAGDTPAGVPGWLSELAGPLRSAV